MVIQEETSIESSMVAKDLTLISFPSKEESITREVRVKIKEEEISLREIMMTMRASQWNPTMTRDLKSILLNPTDTQLMKLAMFTLNLKEEESNNLPPKMISIINDHFSDLYIFIKWLW
jgi:hypothetical protein